MTSSNISSTNNPVATIGRSHREWGNDSDFAALKTDGSVVCWGSGGYGGCLF